MASTDGGSTAWSVKAFRRGETPLPEPNLGWNVYGKGVESIGRDGDPETIEVPEPAPDQLLIRIDAVGLCFSDVKLVNQGGDHPKLYGRDLKVEPTRLGHETSVTVVEVGSELADKYHPGQRLAIQPDIHVDGRSTAYGYTIPGGLIQYHVIGSEVLDADDGAYVIPVSDDIGYAAAALSEPWACVEAAYTQRRRLQPLDGGIMWIVGRPDDDRAYEFSAGLEAPGTIVLTDVAPQVAEMVRSDSRAGATIIERNGLAPGDYAELSAELTESAGFDDIVLLAPSSADVVEGLGKLIAFRGTMNLIGTSKIEGKPNIDVGRIHYHYTAFVGNTGPDIAASYGEARNRADVKSGGVAVYVGAGGPMGQMHMQRALESANGPATVIGVDLDSDRLAVAWKMLAQLADDKGRTFVLFNPNEADETVEELVARHTEGRGADDVIVTVPSGPLMSNSAELLADDGMLVLFAGVPNGTMAPLDMSDVYLHNMQFTGTSGSSIEDQAHVLDKAERGDLSPDRSLAAVGGIEAAQDGVQAMLEGRFAGKIVIFPQLSGLPLTGIGDLASEHPDIKEAMTDDELWTFEAENVLLQKFASSGSSI